MPCTRSRLLACLVVAHLLDEATPRTPPTTSRRESVHASTIDKWLPINIEQVNFMLGDYGTYGGVHALARARACVRVYTCVCVCVSARLHARRM